MPLPPASEQPPIEPGARVDRGALPIALTLGDPAGIGPEIVLKACADPALEPELRDRLLVVGDPVLVARDS